MNLLEVRQLTKSYCDSKTVAVHQASFTLAEGKILALVGESGSGKTTLLRLLAGLEKPDEGEIRLAGVPISTVSQVVPPEKRQVGLVFQHHALFPHLTVEKNIAYGISKLKRSEQKETVVSLLELIGLPGFEKRYPHELSGGERQRIALARALAPNPKLLLLDEPFSSLDARLRQNVRDETRAILKKRGATAIFVTHDTSDALAIADQIVVLRHGVAQQEGAPSEIYHAPGNAYVAAFFGTCNFLPFQSIRDFGNTRLICHIGPEDNESGLWVRPEDLELVPEKVSACLLGEVRQVNFCGGYREVILESRDAQGAPFDIIVHHRAPFTVDPGQRWAIKPRQKMPRP